MVFKRNKRLYDILIYLILFTSCLTINGQVISDKDIKSYAEKLNQDITGLILDSKTGVKGRGVISIGRKIIYQYDVPDDWYPFDDIKQVVVKGILDNGSEKFYVFGGRLSKSNENPENQQKSFENHQKHKVISIIPQNISQISHPFI